MNGARMSAFDHFRLSEPEQWRAYRNMCEHENMSPYPEETIGGGMVPGEIMQRVQRNHRRLDFLRIVKGEVEGRFR